jgi:hypothetical protein
MSNIKHKTPSGDDCAWVVAFDGALSALSAKRC